MNVSRLAAVMYVLQAMYTVGMAVADAPWGFFVPVALTWLLVAFEAWGHHGEQ